MTDVVVVGGETELVRVSTEEQVVVRDDPAHVSVGDSGPTGPRGPAGPPGVVDMSALDAHVEDTTVVHGIYDTHDLVFTADPRLQDAREPLAHAHPVSEVTGFTEAVQDTIGLSIQAGSNVTVSYNDETGVLTVGATATANSNDEFLLARENHTGTQPISSIAGLQDVLDQLLSTEEFQNRLASALVAMGLMGISRDESGRIVLDVVSQIPAGGAYGQYLIKDPSATKGMVWSDPFPLEDSEGEEEQSSYPSSSLYPSSNLYPKAA